MKARNGMSGVKTRKTSQMPFCDIQNSAAVVPLCVGAGVVGLVGGW